MLTPMQYFILGIIQGICEWLPIGSSTITSLVASHFFNLHDTNILIKSALFLHIGTFLAALIYFRKDVTELFKTTFQYKYSDEKNKHLLKFIIISTIITGLIGLILLRLIPLYEDVLTLTGKTITLFAGVLLLLTGIMHIKLKKEYFKTEREIKNSDSIILGILQGLATLPGISRLGITTSTMLMKRFDDTTAIRLSFIMSLPIILIANIFLNIKEFSFTNPAIYGLFSSFLVGIFAIHILMKITKKINFGWFALGFSILMLGSLFI